MSVVFSPLEKTQLTQPGTGPPPTAETHLGGMGRAYLNPIWVRAFRGVVGQANNCPPPGRRSLGSTWGMVLFFLKAFFFRPFGNQFWWQFCVQHVLHVQYALCVQYVRCVHNVLCGFEKFCRTDGRTNERTQS